jgi:hypothetical protein
MTGHQTIDIMFDENDGGIGRSTNACRTLGNSIQYRLDIRGGARNDPQDFARRRLLFQRLL